MIDTFESFGGKALKKTDILEFDGFFTEPVVAPINHCRIYFNKDTGKLMYSEDGGPYKEFMSVEDSVAFALAAKALIVERVLDEDVDAGKIVTSVSGTNVVLAQSSVAEKAKGLGISLTSGVTGDVIKVLLFGNFNDPNYNFTLNAPLYLTTNGNFSETPPSSGYRAIVAYSNGSGSIFIKIEEPVEI